MALTQLGIYNVNVGRDFEGLNPVKAYLDAVAYRSDQST